MERCPIWVRSPLHTMSGGRFLEGPEFFDPLRLTSNPRWPKSDGKVNVTVDKGIKLFLCVVFICRPSFTLNISFSNQQPALQKVSMMGSFVKVLPWSTFRVNPSCASHCNLCGKLPRHLTVRIQIAQQMKHKRQVPDPDTFLRRCR